MDRLKKVVLHPFLWSLYPIGMLIAYNIQQMSPVSAYRSLLVSLLLAALLFAGLKLLLKNGQKAGLLVTLAVLLFFTYGHVYGLLEDVSLFNIDIGRHLFLVLFWFALFIAAAVWVLRTRRDLSGITQALNVIAIIALAFPILQISSYEISSARSHPSPSSAQAAAVPLDAELAAFKPVDGQVRPDIYYIILDAYSQEDTLSKFFGYDNKPFLQKLADLGFYVARCSQSNYSATQLSLASSLNFNYLNELGVEDKDADDQAALNRLIQSSQARQVLKQLGYQTVVIESGFSPTDWRDADIYLSSGNGRVGGDFLGGVNPFEALLLRTSGGLLLYKASAYLPDYARSFLDTAYNERRSRILYALAELPKIPEIAGPKFVFVHILAPHEPFVFGPNGQIVSRNTPFTLNGDLEYRDPKKYAGGYRDQVKYLNTRLLPILQEILAGSKTPPIIVLQGDHGSLSRASSPAARMTILNAYYFPGGAQNLYETISPVNTFRAIFNTYFGSHLSLVDDASYYLEKKAGAFRVIPNVQSGCTAPTN